MALYNDFSLSNILKKEITGYLINVKLMDDIKDFTLKQNTLKGFYRDDLSFLIRNSLVLSYCNIEIIFNRWILTREKLDKMEFPPRTHLDWYYYLDKILDKGKKIFKTIFCLLNEKERDCLIRIAEENSQNGYAIDCDSVRKFKIEN